VHRLLRKFETAKGLVPQPVISTAGPGTPAGAIFFGSTTPAMREAIEAMHASGLQLDTLRLRAFPFPDSVARFIAGHERVFVVEQNRDAQMRSLLINELGIDPAKLVPILHYDGTPITARFIAGEIAAKMGGSAKVTPIGKERMAHS
jgi:2-oxoglutarate ferredoxin oxidoreductase subunit alpha